MKTAPRDLTFGAAVSDDDLVVKGGARMHDEAKIEILGATV